MRIYLVILLGCIIGVIVGIVFYYKPWLQIVSLPDQSDIAISVDHNRINIPVQIGDTTINMLWDTGAERTVLSIDVADKLCIKYDTTNLSYMSVLAGTVIGDNYGVFGCNMVDIPVYNSEKIQCKIGEEKYVLSPKIISGSVESRNVLGLDFITRFYSAIHLTDQKLSLSTKPLSFSEFEIIDSVVFAKSNQNNDIRSYYRVNVKSDSLNLLFDSGMHYGIGYADGIPFYSDIVLKSADSASISCKIFNEMKRNSKIRIVDYKKNDSTEIIYDSLFSINSHKIISYIPYYNVSNDRSGRDRSNEDGYVTFGFISRFDIFYNDPKSRTIKLYKIKDYKSLSRDVSIWEYSKGLKVVDYRK